MSRIGSHATILGERIRSPGFFINTYGSVTCRNIHQTLFGRSFDLTNPDDRLAFDQAGGHDEKCPLVVGRAAQWTVEILGEELGEKVFGPTLKSS